MACACEGCAPMCKRTSVLAHVATGAIACNALRPTLTRSCVLSSAIATSRPRPLSTFTWARASNARKLTSAPAGRSVVSLAVCVLAHVCSLALSPAFDPGVRKVSACSCVLLRLNLHILTPTPCANANHVVAPCRMDTCVSGSAAALKASQKAPILLEISPRRGLGRRGGNGPGMAAALR